MADLTFNTISGATVERKLLILYLNTGTDSSPVWSPVGKRVEDSSMEFDWGEETKTDIFGKNYTTLKTPTITQTFDPVSYTHLKRFRSWLIDKFLPEWCREELIDQNKKLKLRLSAAEQEITSLNAYINGMHAALRYNKKMTFRIRGDADGVTVCNDKQQ